MIKTITTTTPRTISTVLFIRFSFSIPAVAGFRHHQLPPDPPPPKSPPPPKPPKPPPPPLDPPNPPLLQPLDPDPRPLFISMLISNHESQPPPPPRPPRPITLSRMMTMTTTKMNARTSDPHELVSRLERTGLGVTPAGKIAPVLKPRFCATVAMYVSIVSESPLP